VIGGHGPGHHLGVTVLGPCDKHPPAAGSVSSADRASVKKTDVPQPHAVEGDQRLAELVDLHFDFIWRLLRRLGFAASAADDAAQEVFLIALRRSGAIEPGSERSFLYGTALRVVANLRRTKRRRPEHFGIDLDAEPAEASLPDEQAELRRACGLLDRMLSTLPPKLARVLILAEIEELEAGEIALLERIPVGTVGSRLRRARLLLRQKLAKTNFTLPGSLGQ
jgi:RNA polymerase sigma-70 factor, ECF subfamily